MKKNILIILMIVTIFTFTPNVYADRGDLRYDITAVNISGSEITFKGWAFIHRTNNSNSDSPLDYNQQIEIRAYKNGTGIESISVYGGTSSKHNGTGDKSYNFYNQHCYKEGNTCQNKYYLNRDAEYYSCSKSGSDDCLYEDISFSITFDVSGWNVSSTDDITFKIRAYNDWYKNHGGSSNSGWSKYENLGVKSNITVNSSETIIVDRGSLSNKVKFIAEDGRVINKENNSLYTKKCNGQSHYAIGVRNAEYEISPINTYGFTKGYIAPQPFKFDNTWTTQYYNSGFYAIKTNVIECDDGIAVAKPYTSGNVNSRKVPASWLIPSSNSVFKINVNNIKKCPKSDPKIGSPACNNSKSFGSKCEARTIQANGKRAEISMTENGTISSVLTATKLYVGGGFKLGIIYNNRIELTCNSGNCNDNGIREKIRERIKPFEEFEQAVNISDVIFDGDLITESFEKICKTETKNTLEKSNKESIITTCTFNLPSSIVLDSGAIQYNEGTSQGINNKYYTNSENEGEYNISFKLTGMERLKNTITDSIDGTTKWTGNWNSDEFQNCKIEVDGMLTTRREEKNEEEATIKYNFIYRPIDINNPFPDRIPGYNWYDWLYEKNGQTYVKKESNWQQLKDSYKKSNLEYKITLDKETISQIKKYNLDQQYNYFDEKIENNQTFMRIFFGKDEE